MLAEARVEELGFPGAGHGGLLRSRGELGASKSGRILLGAPQGCQGEPPAVWERETGAAGYSELKCFTRLIMLQRPGLRILTTSEIASDRDRLDPKSSEISQWAILRYSLPRKHLPDL